MLTLVQSLSRRQKRWVLLLADCVVMLCALGLATALAGPVHGAAFLGVAAVMAVMSVGASQALGLAPIRLKDFAGAAVLRYILHSALLSAALVPLALGAGLELGASGLAVFGFGLLSGGLTLRFGMRELLEELYRRALLARRVVIYGAGATGAELAAALRGHAALRPVAFVDDNVSIHGLSIAGLDVIPPTQLSAFARERAVDGVLLALPSLAMPKQMQIARRMQDLGLEVSLLPAFSQLLGGGPLLERLAPVLRVDLFGRDSGDGALGAGSQCYRGRTILISGAGGSIGSELCRQVLACAPARIILFELSEGALYAIDMELRQLRGSAAVEIVPVLGSVADPALVREVLAAHTVDVVLHAAAYKHVPLVEANPVAGIANNVLGTQVLAREALQAGISRFILISTDKAVRPVNVMGASKRFGEMLVQDLAGRVPRGSGPRFSIVRLGNVLGSSGSVIPLFQDQVRRGGPVTVTHPEVTRYFMTVREAVQLVLHAGAVAEGGEVHVLDMGRPMRILDLARQTIEASGHTIRDAARPDGDIAIEIVGLRPGDKLHEELTSAAALTPTGHGKILRAHEAFPSEVEIARALRAIREAVAQRAASAASDALARVVSVPSGAGQDAAASPEPAIEQLGERTA
ncbi:MAG: nucleoside-diphosphate sugar epimerase/dehydratase [Pseudomonadota bacterium]